VHDEDSGSTNTPQRGGHGGTRSSQAGHVSVLLQEAIDFLAIKRGGTYIDATVGLGGHSYEIARRLGPAGHLIGFDKDARALELARERLSTSSAEEKWPRMTFIHASFAEVAERVRPGEADGILADLGVSSLQLNDPSRGFSFQAEGPLDMRMDAQAGRTAEQVVNHMREEELANVLYEFGEERRSRRIARAIVRARPVRTTAHLAQVISAALRSMKHGRIHPATRTFQAIRIFVNGELEDLKALLAAAPSVLRAEGRLVVISFHSLEDRMVKEHMRGQAAKGIYELLMKKPVTARAEEVDRNPRARSAKLRAAEKL
jgi:16S rRNA (cytosine1402-N4)-methyltransferase